MVAATYKVEIDLDRDGTYGAAGADVFQYVINNMQWNNGMRSPTDEVAPPARLTLKLDNSTGAFNLQSLVVSGLLNGDFADWTGDDPDEWTVTGQMGVDPSVSEVAPSESAGGSGAGACNLYSTGATGSIAISQSVLTVGQRYTCDINITTRVNGGIRVKSGTDVVSQTFQSVGIKTFTFTATHTDFVIENVGSTNITIDNVTLQACAFYYNRLRQGTLVKVSAARNGVDFTQLYVGKIASISVNPAVYGEKTVTVACQDGMYDLLEAEYIPEFQTNVTVDDVLSDIFESGVVAYPYHRSFWLLGVDGASELGSTTYIFGSSGFLDFETGNTTLPYTGDVNDRGAGVSAQGYIRDLVAAEAGGRFFFNTRTGKFTFHNRQYNQLLNVTPYTGVDDDNIDIVDHRQNDDVFNSITVNYQPRSIGAEGTVLWEATNLPMEFPPGKERTMVARYRDPAQEGARVGGMDMIPPQKNIDYIANAEDDGTGANVTDSVVITVEFGGQSSKVTVINPTTTTLYITTLQLRGTPIYTFDRQFVNSIDGDSIFLNDRHEKTLNVPLIATEEFAQNYADYMVSQFRLARPYFATITFNANKTPARMLCAIDLVTVGTGISIISAVNEDDYIIVGEQHTVTPGGDHTHDVTWILKRGDRELYWLLGTDGFSELGTTTKLAF